MSGNALRCPDGSTGVLISTRPGVVSHSPDIHLVNCSDSTSERVFSPRRSPSTHPYAKVSPSEPALLPRQAAPVCRDRCDTTCITSTTGYNADECDSLSRWMQQRDGQFPVKSGERVVLSWGSCMYAFTNQREEMVTWCDSQWAQIGFDIARPCQANGTGGECNGRGFKVEVISNDGSTNTPIPYSSNIPTTSPVSTASANATTSTTTTQVTTVDLAVYTDLFPPSDPTPTNPNLSDDATMGSSKMLPWLVGAIGGFAFVLICIVLCYYMIWRRSQRQNMMRLASEDGHTKPAVSGSYRMQPPKVKQQQQQQQQHQFTLASTSSEISSKGKVGATPSSQYLSSIPNSEIGRKNNIQSPTENENENNDNTPTGSRPQTGSRVPTSLSTYTLDPDPFRALKRVISGRRNNAKSPAPAVV